VIVTAGNHQISCDVRGDGRPILFVHGVAADRRVLVGTCEPVLERHPGWRRIYVDLPGHGESRGDAWQVCADDLVLSLAAVCRDLQLERPLVVGYSYGGYLAQGLAREVTLGGLFLVCPIVEPDFTRRSCPPQRYIESPGPLQFSEDADEREEFYGIAVRQSPQVLARYQELVRPANRAADRAVVSAIRTRYAMSILYGQALATVDGPVSIVCGRDDHWAGYEDAARLLRLLPRAQLTVLPDCGHLLPLEEEEELGRLLDGWLRRAERV
jgi:pimeloyl-ACP methyl ester carboxylesterase